MSLCRNVVERRSTESGAVPRVHLAVGLALRDNRQVPAQENSPV
jgi:hypothetical protein